MKNNKINVGDVVIFSEGTINENCLFEGFVIKKTCFIFPMKYHVLYLKDGREQINEFIAEELHLKNMVDDLKSSIAKPNQINACNELSSILNDNDASEEDIFKLFLEMSNIEFSRTEGKEYIGDELTDIIDYYIDDVLVSFKKTGELVLFVNRRDVKKCNYTCPIDQEINDLLNEDKISK